MGYIEYNHVSRTRSGLISTRSTRSWPAFGTLKTALKNLGRRIVSKQLLELLENSIISLLSLPERTHCHASWCVYWGFVRVPELNDNKLIVGKNSPLCTRSKCLLIIGAFIHAEGVFLIFDVPPVLPSLTDRTINHLSFFTLDCFILNTPCCTLLRPFLARCCRVLRFIQNHLTASMCMIELIYQVSAWQWSSVVVAWHFLTTACNLLSRPRLLTLFSPIVRMTLL